MLLIDFKESLLLIPIIVFLLYKLKILNVLRALIVILFVLAISGLSIRAKESILRLWLLVDRSSSVAQLNADKIKEVEQIIKSTKPYNAKLEVIEFADVPVMRGQGDANYFDKKIDSSNINLALQLVDQKRDDHYSDRVLILSDGFYTDNLDPNKQDFKSSIPVDLRLLNINSENDYSVSLKVPQSAEYNSNVLITAYVRAPFVNSSGAGATQGSEIPFNIYVNDEKLKDGKVNIVNGYAVIKFWDRIDQLNGTKKYSFQIFPEKDLIVENNKIDKILRIKSDGEILIVSSYVDDAIFRLLKDNNFNVKLINSPERLALNDLVGCRAVIFNNVPASSVPTDFLKALQIYVNDFGGGFMMVGGSQSFGSGGYYGSPIEKILPVTLELKNEIRKIPNALAIVMDKSGSMGVEVVGNDGNMTKMDLANEGAARSIDMLMDQDYASILAVDSAPEIVAELSLVKDSKNDLQRLARGVRVGGGGIYVYVALKAAWDQVKNSKGLIKHIILFSDANDSEEPGKYQELLKEIVANKGTVSVIGMGTTTDVDADLLIDIAKLGKGRSFFTNDALSVPALFAQETATFSRSFYVDDLTKTATGTNWSQISNVPLKWIDAVSGYNLVYRKSDSSTPLLSNDDFNAPLVSFMQYGAGRTAAVLFPLDRQNVTSWKEANVFIPTLVSWLKSFKQPIGVNIRTEQKNNQVLVDLYFDKGWDQKFSNNKTDVALYNYGDEKYSLLNWSKIEPGKLSTSLELEIGKITYGKVSFGGSSFEIGPFFRDGGEEWNFSKEKIENLKSYIANTGGVERLDVSKAWDVKIEKGYYNLTLILLFISIILFILEIFLNRISYNFNIINPRYFLKDWKYLKDIFSKGRIFKIFNRDSIRDRKLFTSKTKNSQSSDNLEADHILVHELDTTEGDNPKTKKLHEKKSPTTNVDNSDPLEDIFKKSKR